MSERMKQYLRRTVKEADAQFDQAVRERDPQKRAEAISALLGRVTGAVKSALGE